MADSDKPTDPKSDACPTTKPPYWWPLAEAWLPRVLMFLAGLVTSYVGLRPAPVVVPGPPIVYDDPAAAEWKPGQVGSTGWVPVPDVIAENADPVKTLQFSDTPAGKAVLGDDDVFLWQAVRKVNNRGPPWYPNVNQKDVGCCVGCGWKHAADVCQAMQILGGRAEQWKPISVESIYGPSRVEVGGGRIRGDGSVGSWAKGAVERIGVLPMEAFPGGIDLTAFSPARAREWGRTGMPDALEPTAKLHPVKGCALVRSWADVKRSIQQGYPVAICSDQGFSMSRDATGLSRASGTWNHCMACFAVATVNGRERGFILNSWGDSAHTGPAWPADMPVAGFWADSSVIDRMVRQGDSFALSDLAGFERRPVNPDWLFIDAPAPVLDPRFVVHTRPAAPRRFDPAEAFALAP